MEKSTAIVLTNGLLDTPNAKTCHGLLRGTDRFEILAVIDYHFAGQDAGEVLDGKKRGIPIFSSVPEYFASGMPQPQFCIVGVALAGGMLPADFRQALKNAMANRCSLVNGLHTFLSEDPEFIELARIEGVGLIDIRKPKPRSELKFWSGEIFSVKAPRIAVLGTDCAVGKRTTCRFIMEMCRDNGIKAEMIYTGQTGWMQGYPYGLIFDSVVNDFVSGEVERAIVECDRGASPELILLEGQSALRNPTGPCGSEFLVSGQAKGVILQHPPGREYYEGTEEFHCQLPKVADEMRLIEMYGAKTLGITLNEEHTEEDAIAAYQKNLEAELGIPVVQPLKEGVGRLLPAIKAYLGK